MLAKMRPFEYVRPNSLQEAFEFVDRYENGLYKAGGSDVFVQMKNQENLPECIIDLMALQELEGIKIEENQVQIGALTRMNEIAASPDFPKLGLDVLSDAAGKLGSYQVRNRATIGGNVCNASPAADMAAPLLSTDASAVVEGKSGRRTIPMTEFFLGPGRCALEKGELLLHLEVPLPSKGVRSKYIKHGNRRAMTLAVVGVAASILVDGSGICREARIALSAVAPTPIRARNAEASLLGKEITEDAAKGAGDLAAGEASPITDLRATDGYRRQIIKVQTRRLLLALASPKV